MTDGPSTLDCGCTADHVVCAHHRSLRAYQQAFASPEASDLPIMVLRPTLGTFWSELDSWRGLYLAVLVIGPPVGAIFGGADLWVALLVGAALVGLCALTMLFMLVKKVTLDPARRVVRSRNWRGKTVTLRVDEDMRGAAFRYIGVGATAFAANLVLWTPTASARLDSRQWGVDHLDTLAFVLGVPVGGLAGDGDIARAFPGVLPESVKHPVRTALVVLAVLLSLVIGLAVLFVVFTSDADDDESGEAGRPTSVQVNGPKPSSLPDDVMARQDSLDTSLKNVLASDVVWASESEFVRCDEQAGWQRENRYSVQEGARLPDEKLADAFDTAARKAGLVPEAAYRTTNRQLVLSTQNGSDSGSGARANISGFEETESSDAFASASLSTRSECVVTPR